MIYSQNKMYHNTGMSYRDDSLEFTIASAVDFDKKRTMFTISYTKDGILHTTSNVSPQIMAKAFDAIIRGAIKKHKEANKTVTHTYIRDTQTGADLV